MICDYCKSNLITKSRIRIILTIKSSLHFEQIMQAAFYIN
ncbi:hypothetical protein HMPREF0476_1874 [Kingella kingae ATCC 23330]|uniref:Uncharacterized protein n=1 Tax=Kingella kingae ATCC 23330 TaxID=887327 RepID=F5S9J1_KINKI|nr:hypothetical protein HMPREF0476_1874 [Kingella kingae ATCC 23330]